MNVFLRNVFDSWQIINHGKQQLLNLTKTLSIPSTATSPWTISFSCLLSAVVIACLIISMWLLRVVLEKKLNYFSILNLFLASILTFFYSMPILYRLYVISQSKIAPPYGKGLVDSES